MKNLLKILACLAALMVVTESQAQVTATTTATAAATNSIITNAARVQYITIANDAASALTVKFFDAPSTNLTYTLGAYTNYLSYTTNIVSIYTTPAGVPQTNTNTGIYTYANTVAASTNSYRVVATISVAASSTLVYYPTNGMLVTFGLSVTNNTNCTITTVYSNDR